MTQARQVYRCGVCGNMVKVVSAGGGELTCCGAKMVFLKEKQQEAAEGKEKHIPVVEQVGPGVQVRVGAIPHPMEAAHFIEWIEVSGEGWSQTCCLKPEDTPQAKFDVPAGKVVARAYCNKHGLWRTQSS